MELRKHRDSLAEDRRRILEALPEWSWRPHSDRWPLNYDLLTKFVRREGHAVVPRSHIEEGVKLGAWVGVQRQDRLKLSKMRRDLLEKLPGWTWDPLEDLWIRNFSVLGKFVAREGSALVPSKHVEDDFNLGDWVVDQRRKRFQMSPERQEKLESLPGWIWNTADEAWNQKFELLVEFVSREGTSLVPQRHVEQGVALGSWVAVQRRSKNSLDVDRKTRLEGLPKWSWSPVSDRWPENFSLLQQYVAREGTASVPLKHVEGNVNLGFWVNYQRQRKQKMSRERRMRLESLPGWRW